MFTLKAKLHDHFYTVDADTFPEILSLAIAAFDVNAQLISISEDEKVKYQYTEIYALINKAEY